MKVKFQEDYRSIYTVQQYESAKIVIASEKEDECPVKDYASMALNCLCFGMGWTASEIIQAEATTVIHRNIKEYNSFGEGSNEMDVCISAIATIFGDFGEGWTKAYIEIYTYLSDLWACGIEDQFTYRDINYSLYAHKA